MAKVISSLISIILMVVIVLDSILPQVFPQLTTQYILLMIVAILATSFIESADMFSKINKQLLKLVETKNLLSNDLSDSLSMGFELCKGHVSEFRVYSISSTKILSYIEPKDDIYIDNCMLMVRDFSDCTSEKNKDFKNEIQNNIRRWENMQAKKKIGTLTIRRYNNYPLDFTCIFDNKFLTLGLYLVDEADISNVKVDKPMSITKYTESGRLLIKKYTKRFDTYFEASELVRDPCLGKKE